MDLKKLGKKFPEEDLEWRIQQAGSSNSGNDWALVVPYIQSRAVMQRLDEACGLGAWQDEYKLSPCGTGYMCGISILINGQWVTRWDGAEKSGGNIDNVKTTCSTSIKRTGVKWGIGRYLYQFDSGFATVKPVDSRRDTDTANGFIYHENKKKNQKFQWKPPTVPVWALPVTPKEIKKYIEAMENAESLANLRVIYQGAHKLATTEEDDELLKKFTTVKDSVKKDFEESAESDRQEKEDNIDTLITRHVKLINSAKNESTANGLAKLALVEVKEIARGDKLKQSMKDIKITLTNKLKQLQG